MHDLALGGRTRDGSGTKNEPATAGVSCAPGRLASDRLFEGWARLYLLMTSPTG
jgi:hypothetical protein